MLEDNFRKMFEARELKANLATATRMKAAGKYSITEIAEMTQLPLSKVRAIGRKPRAATSRTRSPRAGTARRIHKAVPAGV